MCVLITGSSGYFGRIVGRDLISKGYRVVGVDMLEDGEQQVGDQFRYYRCSITDKERLGEIFQKERPSVVLHFACSFNKIRDRKKEYLVDVAGSANVFEAANLTDSVRRLVYSSSAAIYGCDKKNGLWLTEMTPVNPGKYRYGKNKSLIEEILFSADRRECMHPVSLRICTVVGPNYSKPKSIVSLLIRLPYLPRSFTGKKIQFIHEEDFLSLINKVIVDEEIEGIFNVATDSFAVLGDILSGKKYFNLSVVSLKPLIWLLWNLKILNLQPAGIKYCIYPVILDPSKLVSRYNYVFKFSSSESFACTVVNNSLPAGAKF